MFSEATSTTSVGDTIDRKTAQIKAAQALLTITPGWLAFKYCQTLLGVTEPP